MKKTILGLFVSMVVIFSVNFAIGRDVNAPPAVEKAAVQDLNQAALIFDGKELTLRQLQYISPSLEAAKVKKAAEYWLDSQLLYEQAVREGLADDEKTKFLADISGKKVYANAVIEKTIGQVDINDQQAQKYYDDNKETSPSIKEPMYLSFSHIAVNTVQEANSVLEKLKEGGDINALAKELSVANDAKRGGKAVKYQQATVEVRYGKELLDALLAAKEGDIIGPIKSKKDKYEIVRHEGKIEPKVREFDAVKDRIKAQLEGDAKQKAVEELLKKLRQQAESRCVRKGILSQVTDPNK